MAAVLALAIAVYDYFDVSSTELASVGWGLYLTLLGTIAATVLVAKQRKTLIVSAEDTSPTAATPADSAVAAAPPVPPVPVPPAAPAPAPPVPEPSSDVSAQE